MQDILEEREKSSEERDLNNVDFLEIANNEIETSKKKILEKSQKIIEQLETLYNEMRQEEEKILEVAKKLEMNYTITRIENMDIYPRIKQVKENLQRIEQQIQENNNLENINRKINTLDEIESKLKDLKIKEDYISELKWTFEKSFEIRVQELIKNTKVLKLEEEKEKIENEKVSIFGKILGKSKLKQTKLDNVNLKIQIQTLDIKTEKATINLEDSLSDLYVYSQYELEKQLEPEMQQFINTVENEQYLQQIINHQDVKSQVEKKASEIQRQIYLIPVGSKVSNRQQIYILIKQNSEMNREILTNRARTVKKQNDLLESNINNTVLNDFKGIIDDINFAI